MSLCCRAGAAAAALLVLSGCDGLTGLNRSFPRTAAWNPVLINRGANSLPSAITTADLNQDGLTDVIVGFAGGDGGTPSIVAFIQVAPAQWGPVIIATGDPYRGLSSLVTADIDGDSLVDIVAGCQGRIIYLRSPPNPLLGGNWFADVINGSDANTGRWTDLAVVQVDKLFGVDIVGCNNEPGLLSWFRAPQQPLNGSLWERQDIDGTTRAGAAALLMQDVDRDGNIDVISTARTEASATIAWYRHPGGNVLPGAVWQKFAIGNLSDAARIDVGDLNRDGLLDVAVTSPNQKVVGWYAQPADLLNAAWSGFVLAEFTGNTPTDVRVTDVDVNGQLDVIASTGNAGTLRWFTPVNDVRGRWVENNQADIGENVTRILLADIDRDARPDVVAALLSNDPSQDAVAWYLNPEP